MSGSFVRRPDPRTALRRRAWLAHCAMAGAVVAFGFGRAEARTGTATAAAAPDDLIFDAESMPDLLRALGARPAAAGEIRLSVPEQVDNGAVVPVTAESLLPDTTEMLLVVDVNPNPVALRLAFAPGTEAFLSTRLRMAEAGTVYAIVRAGGQLYAAERRATVTVGGCA